MQLSNEEEDYNLSLSKFESMLKTNKVLFFDSEEFEEIILHYLDMGKAALAKKALKLALDQHPKSTGLKLVQVEMLVYDDKLELAEKLLNELFAIEPTNEEIYIHYLLNRVSNGSPFLESHIWTNDYCRQHCQNKNHYGSFKKCKSSLFHVMCYVILTTDCL